MMFHMDPIALKLVSARWWGKTSFLVASILFKQGESRVDKSRVVSSRAADDVDAVQCCVIAYALRGLDLDLQQAAGRRHIAQLSEP
jgi:hypothetical protein